MTSSNDTYPASSVKPNRRFFLFTAQGVSLLATLVAVGIAFGIYRLFYWLHAGPVDQFEVRNETLKTALQMFAGFFFVVTAFFSLRTVKATEANARAANRNAEAANENARVANDNAKVASQNLLVAQQKLDLDRQSSAATLKMTEAKQTSERFSKATENLASDKVSTRIGAIYSLGRIASESPQDHQAVFAVISAFVRQNIAIKAGDIENFDFEIFQADYYRQSAADIDAAIVVIGLRDDQYDGRRTVNLSRCFFPRFIFSNLSSAEENEKRPCFRGVNFILSNFQGAHLSGCDFREANFFGADLRQSMLAFADCTGAAFLSAKLDGVFFTGTILADADLDGADLRNVYNLTQEQVDSARVSKSTKLPRGLHLPKTKPEEGTRK